MRKTKSALKHYQRKKFFYKLYLRKYTRNAAIFGYSLILLALSILPLAVLSSIKIILNNEITLTYRISFSSAIILGSILFLVYGFNILSFAYIKISKSSFHSKLITKTISALALSPLLVPLAIVPNLIKRKKWAFATIGMLSLIYTAIIINYQRVLNSTLDWGLFFSKNDLVAILSIIAMLGIKDKYKLNFKTFVPLIVVAIYTITQSLISIKLDRQLFQTQNDIEQLVGRSISVADFWSDMKIGTPINSEPLKSIIANNPTNYVLTPDDKEPTIEIYKANLAKFQAENPVFVNNIAEFLKADIKKIQHESAGTELFTISMPELSSLRTVSHYLCADLIANSDNRDIVLQRNQDIEQVRNLVLSNIFFISKLIGSSIEEMRLRALCYPLQQGTLNKADWQKLTQTRPDWRVEVANGIAQEATLLQSVYDYTVKYGRMSDFYIPNDVIKHKYLPFELQIQFKRDLLFSMDKLKQVEQFLLQSKYPVIECLRLLNYDQKIPQKKLYILTGMCLFDLQKSYLTAPRMTDMYRIFDIAVLVQNYYQKNKKYPESLSEVISPMPVDSIYLEPINYEYGDLELLYNNQNHKVKGFRIYPPADKNPKLQIDPRRRGFLVKE